MGVLLFTSLELDLDVLQTISTQLWKSLMRVMSAVISLIGMPFP
jgi:hypothetical protein